MSPRTSWVFALLSMPRLGLAAALSGPVVCYVSPAGNDAWSGRLPEPNKAKTDGPVATFGAARKLVRAAALAGKPGPLKVVIRGGAYRLTEPLRFGPQDSGSPTAPVIYIAMKGERPVFSGGRRVTGWRKGEGPLWVADVPGVKAATKQGFTCAGDDIRRWDELEDANVIVYHA